MELVTFGFQNYNIVLRDTKEQRESFVFNLFAKFFHQSIFHLKIHQTLVPPVYGSCIPACIKK